MFLAVVCCAVFLGGIAVAQQKAPVEKILDGCSKEVETYCKNVTCSCNSGRPESSGL